MCAPCTSRAPPAHTHPAYPEYPCVYTHTPHTRTPPAHSHTPRTSPRSPPSPRPPPLVGLLDPTAGLSRPRTAPHGPGGHRAGSRALQPRGGARGGRAGRGGAGLGPGKPQPRAERSGAVRCGTRTRYDHRRSPRRRAVPPANAVPGQGEPAPGRHGADSGRGAPHRASGTEGSKFGCPGPETALPAAGCPASESSRFPVPPLSPP